MARHECLTRDKNAFICVVEKAYKIGMLIIVISCI